MYILLTCLITYFGLNRLCFRFYVFRVARSGMPAEAAAPAVPAALPDSLTLPTTLPLVPGHIPSESRIVNRPGLAGRPQPSPRPLMSLQVIRPAAAILPRLLAGVVALKPVSDSVRLAATTLSTAVVAANPNLLLYQRYANITKYLYHLTTSSPFPNPHPPLTIHAFF